MNNVSYDRTIFKTFKTTGNKILLEKKINVDLSLVDGIYVPDSNKHKNAKIGVGKILDLTEALSKSSNLNVGDFVMYDYYASYGEWKDSAIVDVENILIKFDDEAEMIKFLNKSLY